MKFFIFCLFFGLGFGLRYVKPNMMLDIWKKVKISVDCKQNMARALANPPTPIERAKIRKECENKML
ncbi:Oidioi.mRNA.OKI2018_I69.chr2.g4792.t1.cds [Oikopleura dioica]|uniref:Oidioi.mRNA.OKI2018_I69.chr2.g4792.t1.cds n=1 Tax=Oikopleura dioica TaxID=34765 RepID=A0ABN7SYU7_OIKDI|nr:Oidioi.mRNA.OKI2018_I69.chr2.g4792.t1.cds [Oikopleura dioica]